MSPRLARFMLTTHVVVSVGLLGAIASFLALAVIGLVGADGLPAQSAYLAMDRITVFVVVPLTVAALLTGIIQSLGTKWGLFRYYWVVVKLGLTVLAAVVLILQLDLIGYMADAAAAGRLRGGGAPHAGIGLVAHAAGGLLVLLAAAALSVYKPRGMTRYGERKAGLR